jgi:hypothetical protein
MATHAKTLHPGLEFLDPLASLFFVKLLTVKDEKAILILEAVGSKDQKRKGAHDVEYQTFGACQVLCCTSQYHLASGSFFV